jgi:hypothetical protein
MKTNFIITGIDNIYNQQFNLTDKELAEKSMIKMIVDQKPGYPCRVTLEDAEIGEEVLLFPFEFHKTNSPYKASGPVFIRKNAIKAILEVNEIPEMLFQRQQTLRGYDSNGIMITAKSPKRKELRIEIETILCYPRVSYVQIHNTNPGCYNCEVKRVK